MVRQRFRVLFRRWFFTLAKVCGPILVYELFVLVRQHFQYVPLGIRTCWWEHFWLSCSRPSCVGYGRWESGCGTGCAGFADS